ncbi:hypothetical protein WJX73_007315 [Symbiochloris irregularis]|uniref:Uncharacterized protein n=1 Tax=Symbiochloris irregularis TaxID=706552 RepID=A0AAW1PQT6_9CHLO
MWAGWLAVSEAVVNEAELQFMGGFATGFKSLQPGATRPLIDAVKTAQVDTEQAFTPDVTRRRLYLLQVYAQLRRKQLAQDEEVEEFCKLLQKPGLIVPLICALAGVSRFLPELEQDMPVTFQVTQQDSLTVVCMETKASDMGNMIAHGKGQIRERLSFWSWIVSVVVQPTPPVLMRGHLFLPSAREMHPGLDTRGGFNILLTTGLDVSPS